MTMLDITERPKDSENNQQEIKTTTRLFSRMARLLIGTVKSNFTADAPCTEAKQTLRDSAHGIRAHVQGGGTDEKARQGRFTFRTHSGLLK